MDHLVLVEVDQVDLLVLVEVDLVDHLVLAGMVRVDPLVLEEEETTTIMMAGLKEVLDLQANGVPPTMMMITMMVLL